MKTNRALLSCLAAALLAGSIGSTCVVASEGPEDIPYGEESAEMQTQDEQMEEVEEQINR
jgi:hypothetical protein